MEADFVRYYGLDLAHEVEHAGLRRLWVLINGLPKDAMTWADEMKWTHRDEIQTLTLERLDAWGRAIFQALGGKVRGKPLELPRPDQPEPLLDEPKKEIIHDPGEIAQFFGRHFKG